MTFLHLTATQLLATFAGLLGVLYLLQRLRVRHREIPVVTTLFWQQAVQESRARVLTKRFRHPWAFLLIATIVGLMLFALAGPKPARSDRHDHLIYLDASAGMAAEGRFEEALRTLDETIAALPRDSTRVVMAGADLRTLLLPGEAAELLPRRLEGVEPEPAPPSIERALRSAASVHSQLNGPDAEAATLSVWVVGDAPIAAKTLAMLPENVDVRRVEGTETRAPDRSPDGSPGGDVGSAGSAGITTLGVSEAASGAWSTVDVLVSWHGAQDNLSINLDEMPLDTSASVVNEDGSRSLLLRDVPARGGLLTAQTNAASGSPFDDQAKIRMPDRPPIRVRVADEFAAALMPALMADPAVELVADGEAADVAIHRSNTPPNAETSLTLVSESDQDDAFVIEHGPEDAADQVLQGGLEALGLLEIDATSLATEVGREIRVGTNQTGSRGVSAWASLFGEAYDFRASRAFPLFLARTVRYLGGGEAITTRVAAGEPMSGESRAVDIDGRLQDPAGASLRPPRSGAYTRDDGSTFHASLLSTINVEDFADNAALPLETPPERGRDLGLMHILGLIGFGLLLLEWVLFRTERMP